MWTDAYRGLPWTAPGAGDNSPDAAAVLAARSKRSRTIRVPVGVLVGMASRLASAERKLLDAETGWLGDVEPEDD